MKKKAVPLAICFLLFFIIIALIFMIWRNAPRDFVHLTREQVEKIEIFNGRNGQHLVITEEEHIAHLLDNWSQITLTRGESTEGRSGFTFSTTIYGKDGNDVPGIQNFTINSPDSVAFDGYFWHPTDILFDFDYILELYPPQN